MSSTPTTSNPVRLHVEDTGGNGRTVLLIHGWPLSAEAWQAQVGPLSEAGFRVIAYDRRGFGRSEKPESGFDYDTLAADLAGLLEERDLRDVTLVGFSMGGGEVARYVANHGEDRLRSVVFAAAVPPCLMKSEDNPDGPLTPEKAKEKEAAFKADREAYFDDFTRNFFSANDVLKVSEAQRQEAIAICRQADPEALFVRGAAQRKAAVIRRPRPAVSGSPPASADSMYSGASFRRPPRTGVGLPPAGP